jgi:protease-4
MKSIIILLIGAALFWSACTPQIHLDFLGKQKLQEVVLVKSEKSEKIVVLDLFGTIQTKNDTGMLSREGDPVSRIYYRLETAARDPQVRGIILRLDTPGGGITASDIIYHEILRFRQKNQIPVVALMMGVAASGGYYVASACDYIIAHPTTITGSIGVITILPDFNRILSKFGIELNVFKSGRMKDSGSPYRKMTSDEKAYFQTLIDAMYKRFVGVIHHGRKDKLSIEEIETLADGRIYSAQKALELRLIDEIGYFESALKKILLLAKLEQASVIAYSYFPLRKTNIYARPGLEENPLKVEVKGLDYILPTLKPGLYYLWLPAVVE